MTTSAIPSQQIDRTPLFRPDSDYYFSGEPRKRQSVLVAVIALIVTTFIFAGGLALFNLEAWQNSISLSLNGVEGTANYTRSDVDVSHVRNPPRRTYYFVFNFTVKGQRYEGRHQVDRATYDLGVPAGQPVAILYDATNPANVQAQEFPPSPPIVLTIVIVLLLVGGIGLSIVTMRDYNRPYKPTADGLLANAVITGVTPNAEGDGVEVHFRYTNPFTKQEATGSDTLPAAELAATPAVGQSATVISRTSQQVRLL